MTQSRQGQADGPDDLRGANEASSGQADEPHDMQETKRASAEPSENTEPAGHLDESSDDSSEKRLGQAIDDVLNGPEQHDGEVVALWETVLEAWDEPARHELFLQACVKHEDLAYAAQRYGEQRQDEQRRALAEKKLTTITMLAVQLLDTKRAARPPVRTPRWVYWLAVVACMAALWWLAHAFSAR